MSAKQRLGRGLDALIREEPAGEPAPAAAAGGEKGESIVMIKAVLIRPNPAQPRRVFEPEALEELAASIREHGLIQPLTVRRNMDFYELIAGERRLMAAQKAGLEFVPALVKQADEKASLEIALVENLQRKDLNVIEEAEGYKRLCERFGLTQEQAAERVGKARATVANALRVLELPADIRQMLADGRLTHGHAKALLGLAIDEERVRLARRAAEQGMSVRDLEAMVARLKRGPRPARASKSDIPEDYIRHLEDKLHRHFGTAVHVAPCRNLPSGRRIKGNLEIEFYSDEELHRILEILGLAEGD